MFKKQPYEYFPVSGDFRRVMPEAEGDTISSQVVSAVDSSGADATATILENASIGTGEDYQKVFVYLKDGTSAGSPYTVTFKIVTTAGNKWQIDEQLVVG